MTARTPTTHQTETIKTSEVKMTANILVTSPYQPFTLPNKFGAVFNGKVYVGEVDKDPLTNPVQVYLVNEDGTQVQVSQPLLTNAGGYLVYNGQPAKFVTASNHSLKVITSLGVLAWYEPNMANFDPQTFIQLLAGPNGVNYVGGAAKQTDVTALTGRVVDLEAYEDYVGRIPSFSKTAVGKANANISAFGRLYSRNNIVLIGDSITAGFGASVAQFSYASLFSQAVANYYKDGYGYPMIRNTGPASYIYTHNGTQGTAGLSGDSISLIGPSQAIGLRKSEGIGVCAYVEASVSTATTIQLLVNGTVVSSASITGSLYEALLILPSGASWTSSDDVTITSPAGTLVISGITVLKYGNSVVNQNDTSPLMISCGKSGESFSFFRSNKAQTANMSKFISGSGSSPYIIALGTNSIYNQTEAQTPSEYVASMLGLEADLKSINASIDVIFTIPPQADESLWPVIKQGYTYQDYVDAITAAVPIYQLIDLNIQNLTYADGVHPDDAGHIAIARRMCEALGIPFNTEPPSLLKTQKLIGFAPLFISSGYAARDIHGVKYLSGKCTPNGATTNLITTLPSAYRPVADRFIAVAVTGSTNGLGIIQIIATSGEVRLISNPSNWTSLYLDGVSYI